mmetsp:Transcript_7365/g.10436  ORF Transcript_7365/g.10436 Transcript_7365/m.10436 type:complete len:91 (-) Transcript_7365:265-537(-)
MHHVEEVHFLFDYYIAQGLVDVRMPSRAVHGPAPAAVLVQQYHVFVHRRGDHAHLLRAVVELQTDYMVVIPDHVQTDINAFIARAQQGVL